jgi:ubiquinone/menaquinone biosynthesis C-methylase UbiE
MEQYFEYYGKKCSREEVDKKNKEILENLRKNPDERVLTVLQMVEGDNVLDVGCAAGTISRLMGEKGHKVLGIDRVDEYARLATEFNSTENVTFETRDVLKNPFPDKSFDCITFLETIEHVENPAQFLREFHRILRSGGCVIISTPNATSLKNLLYALSYRRKEKRDKIAKAISKEPQMTGTQLEHIYNWDFPTLVRLIDKCGFDVEEHKFVRAGPIIVPIFGKRTRLVGGDSKILERLDVLKTTHVIKCRKREN